MGSSSDFAGAYGNDTLNVEAHDLVDISQNELAVDAVSDDIHVVTEAAEGRQRQISATIRMPYSADQIWQILTDYEHLADFIPNLATSRCLLQEEGRVRLEQIGTESLMRIKFCARVVLDMVEKFPHEIDFKMVEGDFKSFFGAWQLQPIGDGRMTELRYMLNVLPPRTMPIGLIERRMKQNLATNLMAIRQRADELFGESAP
ncbi:SRPBCC family protein [Leptolyngbya sp. AN02str]|uniref:SRPBCC family protein n=1 Tax=Leptolyngbya sp. AN02str TaxID=3423363 RepID=UPI003D312D6F